MIRDDTEKEFNFIESIKESGKAQLGIVLRHFLQAQKELLEFRLGLIEDGLRVMKSREPKTERQESKK